MAAITAETDPGNGIYTNLFSGTAQANVGSVKFVNVPAWARYADFYLNITAVAGTTPILTPFFYAANPVTRDDADLTQIHGNFTSPPTAAGLHRVTIGNGVTPTDDLAMAASGDSHANVNIPLPNLLAVELRLDRGTGDETYTYTAHLHFRR